MNPRTRGLLAAASAIALLAGSVAPTFAGLDEAGSPAAHARRRAVRGPALQYVLAYDSSLRGDWNIATWQDETHPVSANANAAAPSRSGTAIEVQFSENGWGAFGLANTTDWINVHYLYLNEFRTIDFDLYITPDASGMQNLRLILDDSGNCDEPQLVSYIAGWDPAHPQAVAGRWIPVRIDLTKVEAKVYRFMRFLFYNAAGASRPHFFMANVRLGWMEDSVPPQFTSVSATPSATYDTLTLAFTNDKAVSYRVEYGLDDYAKVIEGDPDALAASHTAVLTGFVRGNIIQYRITAWAHRQNPASASAPSVTSGTYKMPPPPTAPPVISDFVATPSEIAAGASAKLTWLVTDYDALTIDPGVGSVTQIPGTTGVLVTPSQTTTYTLRATNTVGSADRSVTVTIHPVATIRHFTATPSKIAPSGTSVLTWDVANSDTIYIDHGVGEVTTVAGSTGVPVNPQATTTYVLTASNARSTARQTATVTVASPAANLPWIMGYYVGYQSLQQPPKEVDYRAMTHIMVGAVLPRTEGTFETHFYLGDTAGPAWAKETVQRAHGSGIKAILMVGGSESSAGFRATSDPAVRAAFVRNLRSIVTEYGFDGVDLDWEPLDPSDRDAIVPLLEQLQAPDALPRGSTIYTLPLGWNNANFDNMAHPFYGQLAVYFDRVSTMSYSMFWLGYGWESWHSSALYGHSASTPSSIDNTVQAMRAAGIPDSKIGIGIGFYGASLENGRWTGGQFVHLDPPAIPAYVTDPHQSTETAVSRYGDNALSYSNIMQYLHSGTAYRWDDTARVPYLSFTTPASFAIPGLFSDMRTTYVTYENEQSIAEKVSYVRNHGLGGVIIWTISQGYLGAWKEAGELDPLMKAVVAGLR